MSPSTTASPVRRHATTQRWSAYRPSDHAVWATLYRRRMHDLQHQASQRFLEGLDAIGLEVNQIPDLEEVNRRLGPRTGWSAVPVTGFLEAHLFFASLAERRFPTVVTIRSPESLDYTPAPDIFHDVFGHVPLHADPMFGGFLARFGAEAAAATDPTDIERLARLFWFTVEFGLIWEQGEVKVYGSGLISSHAEAAHALGPSCERRPFDRAAIMDTPFEIDKLQPVLYVIEDFEQLFGLE
jgi:phenylalanine-4-hydroxylase